MGKFYKPYPKEVYAVNDLLQEQFVQKQPRMVIITIDFTNRCVNYNAIDPIRKTFQDEIVKNIIGYLKEDSDSVVKYIKKYFPEPQAGEFVRIIKKFAKKDPASLTHAGMSGEAREKAGITDSLVRLAVGCEDIEDLLEDMIQDRHYSATLPRLFHSQDYPL